MAKAKVDKQEKEVAGVCVCGHLPVTVKHKSWYLLACPCALVCAVRGTWETTEQAAIKSWNTEVQAARRRGGKTNGGK